MEPVIGLKDFALQDHTQLTVDAFLNATAERTPTPGGGSVAAAAGALGCALARMVTAYSIGKNTDAGVRQRMEASLGKLRRSDELLRALITRDAAVYEEIALAAKNAKSGPANAAGAYQNALQAGVSVPMEIAAIASRVLALLNELMSDVNTRLFSDLGVAAVLADSAAVCARYTARANLPELADKQLQSRLADELDHIVEHCSRHRRDIEDFLAAHA